MEVVDNATVARAQQRFARFLDTAISLHPNDTRYTLLDSYHRFEGDSLRLVCTLCNDPARRYAAGHPPAGRTATVAAGMNGPTESQLKANLEHLLQHYNRNAQCDDGQPRLTDMLRRFPIAFHNTSVGLHTVDLRACRWLETEPPCFSDQRNSQDPAPYFNAYPYFCEHIRNSSTYCAASPSRTRIKHGSSSEYVASTIAPFCERPAFQRATSIFEQQFCSIWEARPREWVDERLFILFILLLCDEMAVETNYQEPPTDALFQYWAEAIPRALESKAKHSKALGLVNVFATAGLPVIDIINNFWSEFKTGSVWKCEQWDVSLGVATLILQHPQLHYPHVILQSFVVAIWAFGQLSKTEVEVNLTTEAAEFSRFQLRWISNAEKTG